MNLSRDGLSIANMFLMASVRLNLLNRTIFRKVLMLASLFILNVSHYTIVLQKLTGKSSNEKWSGFQQTSHNLW